LAGVARNGLAQHFAGGSAEHSKSAERTVALELEAEGLGAPATTAASGSCGRAPGSRVSRPRRTALCAPAGSDKARSRRTLALPVWRMVDWAHAGRAWHMVEDIFLMSAWEDAEA
jgi:hypothetical protein